MSNPNIKQVPYLQNGPADFTKLEQMGNTSKSQGKKAGSQKPLVGQPVSRNANRLPQQYTASQVNNDPLFSGPINSMSTQQIQMMNSKTQLIANQNQNLSKTKKIESPNMQSHKFITNQNSQQQLPQKLIMGMSNAPHYMDMQDTHNLSQNKPSVPGSLQNQKVPQMTAGKKQSQQSRPSQQQQAMVIQNLMSQQKFFTNQGNQKKQKELSNTQNNKKIISNIVGGQKEANCYTDEDAQQMLKMKMNTESSRNQFVAKSKTQATHPNENQTLYTNISLREISQSPEPRALGGQISQKIMLAAKGQETKSQERSHSQIEQQRQFNNTSFSNYNSKAGGVSQLEFENQMELKNYLSQIQVNEQRNQPDKNGAILNIKTVQDINIYNNSFIVNSNNLPITNSAGNIIPAKNFAPHLLGQVQIQNQNNQQITTVLPTKKGLKLRKELTGLQNGLTQARSASQGRSGNRGISQSSNNNVQSRNITSGLTEYNSYGAIPIQHTQKLTKAYDVYNQTSIAQNPNQKRMLNPSNKMVGNLAVMSGLQNQKVLTQTGYYQNQPKKGGLKQLIKGISSSTSRGQSRADSRQGQRLINTQQTALNHGSQLDVQLQQLKVNYLQNQKLMIQQQKNRAVSQMDNNQSALLNESQGDSNLTVSELNQHSQSQLLNSQQFPSQYQATGQKPNQMKAVNSYEVRKQSLQEMRNQNLSGSQTVHKFRNQMMQLSDHDRSQNFTPINNDTGVLYSMTVKNDQFFSKQGGQKSQSQDNLTQRIVKEFNEKHKTLAGMFLKIKAECEGINIEKEQILKNQVKQIELFIIKVSQLKKQIQTQANASLQPIASSLIQMSQEAIILKGLVLMDSGLNYECVQEMLKINGIKQLLQDSSSLTSDQLLQLHLQPDCPLPQSDEQVKFCLLVVSIAQKRMGDHQKALETVSKCLNQFVDLKDAYLVRGQMYLLANEKQKALQDFIKFDQLVTLEQPLSLQFIISKEALGDAYKKMKNYKQASKCYSEAMMELSKLIKQTKTPSKSITEKHMHIQSKLRTKLAMCAYYMGQIKKAMLIYEDQIKYFSKFDPHNVQVQAKSIKCNFYLAKSILALGQKEGETINTMQALHKLTYCANEEIDPELHELYNGNALFEIFKMFIKQKDIYNAHEYLQRATDNNFNSKRLSLYRDFTEGVVYLMKRKIKKGVQILSDLLEVLINGQKEIERTQKKKDENEESTAKDRYDVGESNDSKLLANLKQALKTTGQKQTIGNNQVASGKFSQEMYDFLIFNIYIYRSYGYVAIEKYEHALEDLKRAKKINPKGIDRATIYNKWLSRGILKMDTEEYLMASKFFGKASLRYPSNKDAFCLNIISIVRSYSFSLQELYVDSPQKLQKVEQTMKFLNVAIDCCCKEKKQPSLYFFRGLLNYQMHKFYDALNDFNVAIAEEEEATGQFHLARGRTYACLSILDEAMKDLTIALELDESLHEAYIFRGKCAYLLGDNNLAFHDFQKLIISDQKNPMVHIHAGNLLMTTGAYTDAIKAFDNADTVQQTPLACFQRIRCFCALSDLEGAFEQMQLCKHQAPNEQFANFDFKVLLQLLSCVRSFAFSKGDNNEPDEQGKKEQLKILDNCVAQISSVISEFEKNKHLDLKKEHSPMSIQIIPNVAKIKVEKRLVINKLKPHVEGIPKYTPLSAAEQKELDALQFYGYYRENIFQLEEMYLYRAMFLMYQDRNSEALEDLKKSWKQHFWANQQLKNDGVGMDTEKEEMYGKFPISQLLSPISSVHSKNSQKTDLSEIGLCSLNINEYSLNQMILYIQLQNWKEALAKVNELLTSVPTSNESSKNLKQLLLVRAMIHQEMGLTDKQNQDMTLYLKNFGQITKNKQNAVVIEPFDSDGRICNQFEPLQLKFQKPKTKSGFEIWMRPSFSMPFIKPPNMIPNINEEVVQSEFNLKQIDAPMPEAPWNRQCESQDFQPEGYIYQLSPRWNEKKKPLPQLPRIAENQSFVKEFLQKSGSLIYDEKVMKDIDDLSDQDKVSLISDIELGDALLESEPERMSLESDEQLGELNLNLKNISKLTQKTQVVKLVHNGIPLKNSKVKCGHKKSCSSCFELPMDEAYYNFANQEHLIENLCMSSTQAAIKKHAQGDKNFEDTVSEEEYATSEEDSKDTKRDESKSSHSRFSSQIDAELAELQHYNDIGDVDGDIEQEEVVIGDGKKLISDNRNLLKKGAPKPADKQFTDKIGSISKDQQSPEVLSPSDNLQESMVLIASKNLGNALKKKSKKIGGIGGTANLKKNKLAIAFNNLELEQAKSGNTDS